MRLARRIRFSFLIQDPRVHRLANTSAPRLGDIASTIGRPQVGGQDPYLTYVR